MGFFAVFLQKIAKTALFCIVRIVPFYNIFGDLLDKNSKPPGVCLMLAAIITFRGGACPLSSCCVLQYAALCAI